MKKLISIPDAGIVSLPKHVAAAYELILALDVTKVQDEFVVKRVFGLLERNFGHSAFAVFVALKRRGLVTAISLGSEKEGAKAFRVVRREFTVTREDYVPRQKRKTTVESKVLILPGMISIGYEYILTHDPKKTSKRFSLDGVSTLLQKRFGGNRAQHMYTELKKRGLIIPGKLVGPLTKRFTVIRAPYQVLGGKPGYEVLEPPTTPRQAPDLNLKTLHQFFISNHGFIAEVERKKKALAQLGYCVVTRDGELLLKRL